MQVSRRVVRYIAAAFAAAMAVIYFGIGAGVLDVGGSSADSQFLWVFGVLAGGVFVVWAVLLVLFDRRWLWIAGLAFQLFVYWAYVEVSKNRNPPFEVWGITLRVIQVPLVLALAYLAWRAPEPSRQLSATTALRSASTRATGAQPKRS